MGCHVLLQCMKAKSESEVAQSCPTLSDPMDCTLLGSSVHGISQARVLEWGATAHALGPCSSGRGPVWVLVLLSALRLGPRKNLFAACPPPNISAQLGVCLPSLSLYPSSQALPGHSKALSGRCARAPKRVRLHCGPRARPFLSLGLSLSVCRRL